MQRPMPPRLCGLLWLSGLAVLTFLAGPVRAGWIDYDVQRARLSLQRADYLLGDAQWAADIARDDLQRADRRAADLAAEIDRQQREVDAAVNRLDAADRAAKQLGEDIDRNRARAEQRQRDLDAARQRLHAARQRLDALTAEQVKAFEAGPEFKAANDAAEQAKKDLAAAEDASLGALSRTEEHKTAAAAADALLARVNFLTEQGERAADELAAAKKELAAAEKKVRDLEDRHLEADPSVREPGQKLARAEQRVAELRSEFDKQLNQRPEVADARKGLDAAQADYDDTLRALGDAEARAADAENLLRNNQDERTLAQDQFKAADQQLRNLINQQQEAEDFAAAANRRYRDAIEAVAVASAERQSAAWSLSRAPSYGFYGWSTPVIGLRRSLIHVDRISLHEEHRRSHFADAGHAPGLPHDFDRPAWARPLTDADRPQWARGWTPGAPWWASGQFGYRRAGDAPVSVRVVNAPPSAAAAGQARERAVELASRASGDEQRRQRQAALALQREQSRRREVKLASLPPVNRTSAVVRPAFPTAAAERATRQAQDRQGQTQRQLAARAEKLNLDAATSQSQRHIRWSDLREKERAAREAGRQQREKAPVSGAAPRDANNDGDARDDAARRSAAIQKASGRAEQAQQHNEPQAAYRRRADDDRRQAVQAQRRQETEARRQRQDDDGGPRQRQSDDGARQRAAAEARARQQAERSAAAESARAAQRDAARQAAARESQRQADRPVREPPRRDVPRSAPRESVRSDGGGARSSGGSSRSESSPRGGGSSSRGGNPSGGGGGHRGR